MKYDTSIPIAATEARSYLDKLITDNAFVEVKRIGKPLSQRHRGYEHILFSCFAIEYGETPDYVKQIIFKQWVNADIFKTEYVNRKTGEVRISWKSTESIGSAQMSEAITRFKNWSIREAGILLPEPHHKQWLNQIECEIERQKVFF
jgi:hypothetical protein